LLRGHPETAGIQWKLLNKKKWQVRRNAFIDMFLSTWLLQIQVTDYFQ
jgi:hypothetical protein